MKWNHRTIEHRDARYPKDSGDDIWYSVHEMYYGLEDDGTGRAFVATPASPRCKEDCERMSRAFDEPPVAWVDEESRHYDEEHVQWDYAIWGWLEPEGPPEAPDADQ
jgi:hypothetical protein